MHESRAAVQGSARARVFVGLGRALGVPHERRVGLQVSEAVLRRGRAALVEHAQPVRAARPVIPARAVSLFGRAAGAGFGSCRGRVRLVVVLPLGEVLEAGVPRPHRRHQRHVRVLLARRPLREAGRRSGGWCAIGLAGRAGDACLREKGDEGAKSKGARAQRAQLVEVAQEAVRAVDGVERLVPADGRYRGCA